jgi:RNA polymerase sigma factor (sigma-70 family)
MPAVAEEGGMGAGVQVVCSEEGVMEAQPYRVKVTVRNNKLLEAIEQAGYSTCADFCRASGLGQSDVGQMIGMKTAPLLKSGEFSALAMALMEVLGAAPGDLWSDEQLTLKLKRNTAERAIDREEALALMRHSGELFEQATPLENALRDERTALCKKALEMLTPREQELLELRFGFDGSDGNTLDELAEAFGVTRERIRQLEARALRKLRHPARSSVLRAVRDHATDEDVAQAEKEAMEQRAARWWEDTACRSEKAWTEGQ